MNIHSSTENVCLHCGTPVKQSGSAFCCRGCELVYSTLGKLGLSAFYSLKPDEKHPTADASYPNCDYSYLDSADVQKKSVEVLTAGRSRVRFYLPSIHCSACVWMLERLPLAVEGVLQTRVNFGSGILTVEYNSKALSTAQVAALLNSIGYPPVIAGELTPKDISEEERTWLRRIGVAAVCAANTMMLSVSLFQSFFTGIEEPFGLLFRWLSALLALPAIIYSAVPFYRTALGSLYMGTLHIDLPISIAIIAAYLAGIVTLLNGGEYIYFDSVTALIFLLLLGRYVQTRAIHRARATRMTAWDLFPSKVRVVENGKSFEKPIAELQIGENFEVLPQERVASDGLVLHGASLIDTAFLTGESVPRGVSAGDQVLGGALNTDGRLVVQATAVGKSTRLGRIISELESSQDEKSPLENEANRLSGYFVVGVLLLAVATYIGWMLKDPSRAFESCIALMIVTCPCALGLAIPAAVAVGMGRAQRAQIYVRKSGALETLAAVESCYFDKTGTLTAGEIEVTRMDIADELFPRLASLARFASAHPVATAIVRSSQGIPDSYFDEIKLVPGRGIEGVAAGMIYRLGSEAWLRSLNISFSESQEEQIYRTKGQGRSISLFAKDRELAGVIELEDKIRPSAKLLVNELVKRGKRVFILSGDSTTVVKSVAAKLNIPESQAIGELMPEDKARIVRADNTITAMIGDGVNDAPAMKAAQLGIGLRGGVEATLETTDIFIAEGDVDRLIVAFKGAWATRRTIRRNLLFSILYNLLGATAAILGYVNPLTAAVLMPCSSLTVVLSSVLTRSFNPQVTLRK